MKILAVQKVSSDHIIYHLSAHFTALRKYGIYFWLDFLNCISRSNDRAHRMLKRLLGLLTENKEQLEPWDSVWQTRCVHETYLCHDGGISGSALLFGCDCMNSPAQQQKNRPVWLSSPRKTAAWWDSSRSCRHSFFCNPLQTWLKATKTLDLPLVAQIFQILKVRLLPPVKQRPKSG